MSALPFEDLPEPPGIVTPEPVKLTERDVTARAMIALLQRHYLPENRPAGGTLATEIDSPCGQRRADAIWAPYTIAGGPHLVGHEVKVTRADVLAELADPTKAEAWAKYCGQWWLVIAHPSLVEGLDIPDAWGVMAPPSGRRTRSMTIVKQAPKLEPAAHDGAAWRRLAIWVQYRAGEQVASQREQLAHLERELAIERHARTDAEARGLARTDPRAPRIAKILSELDRRPVGYHSDEEVDALVVDAIADRLRVKLAADAVRYDLEDLIRAAKKLTEPMQHASAELERLAANPAVARG